MAKKPQSSRAKITESNAVSEKGAKSLTMRSLDELIPYARNPRTHSEDQIRSIADSIERFGFTNPVLLDGQNNIIAGHGRLQAAKLLKLKEVPCVDLHGLSPEEKRAYIIADNQLALNASWDMQVLASEIQQLAHDGMDMSLLGFSDKEMELIERMGANMEDAALEGTTIGGDRFLLMIEFQNETEQQKAFAEFMERGLNVKVLQ